MKTILLSTVALCVVAANASSPEPMREKLKHENAKIAYETYVDNNWEIFVMNADGSNPVNITDRKSVV